MKRIVFFLLSISVVIIIGSKLRGGDGKQRASNDSVAQLLYYHHKVVQNTRAFDSPLSEEETYLARLQAPVDFKIPYFPRIVHEFRFISAQAITLDDKIHALLWAYVRQGHIVSLIMKEGMLRELMAGGKEPLADTLSFAGMNKGYNYICWEEKGVISMLVSDIPEVD